MNSKNCELRENLKGDVVCMHCGKNYGHWKHVNLEQLERDVNCPYFHDQPPNVVTKTKTFTSSLLGHLKNGLRRVDKKTQNKRMSICKECEFFSGGENPNCGKCGCYLNIKTAWQSESCPIYKWKSVKTGKPCRGCSKRKT